MFRNPNVTLVYRKRPYNKHRSVTAVEDNSPTPTPTPTPSAALQFNLASNNQYIPLALARR